MCEKQGKKTPTRIPHGRGKVQTVDEVDFSMVENGPRPPDRPLRFEYARERHHDVDDVWNRYDDVRQSYGGNASIYISQFGKEFGSNL